MEHPFERHLMRPYGRGPVPEGAVVGSAGGGACDDLVRIALRPRDGRVEQVTFEAEGCGASIAAASACVEHVAGAELLDAARVHAGTLARALGGLLPGKLHAAQLAADALHRALGHLWGSSHERLIEPSEDRVLVAMSGGVDSAVAALLELEEGRDVVAVTLQLWADAATDGSKSCCSPQAVVSARALAHSLGLAHLTLDLRERFRRDVVADFLAEHDRGRTPNPCVRCNGLVRFDAMLALAESIGARTLVTGHYARIDHDRHGLLLRRAVDRAKDQSYMLAGLEPSMLEHLRFPLGELTKPDVRELARRADLGVVADKKESQDLCFMAGTTRERFLARHGTMADRSGEVVDGRGRVLGRHRGHRHYTVGQRRGLRIASGEPLYVLSKDPRTNRVVVGSPSELETSSVTVAPCKLYRPAAHVDRVRLRYRSAPVECSVAGEPASGAHERVVLELGEPVDGIAPGQTACLLDGERIVGFGLIDSGS